MRLGKAYLISFTGSPLYMAPLVTVVPERQG